MKKLITLLITLATMAWIAYILFKIIHPIYINKKIEYLVNEKWVDLIKLYNTMVSYEYVEIVNLIRQNKTADAFLKMKMDKFKKTYPFIIWWKTYYTYLRKQAYKWIKLKDIYKLQDKILEKYKIKKSDKWILFYTNTKYIPYPLNKEKKKYCFTVDDMDFYIKNKIAWENILNNLSSLVIYNKVLWKYIERIDICILYRNYKSFVLYWKYVNPDNWKSLNSKPKE